MNREDVTFLVSLDLMSDLLTDHSKKIGALKPSQHLEVNDIEVQENVVQIEGEIVERIMQ